VVSAVWISALQTSAQVPLMFVLSGKYLATLPSRKTALQDPPVRVSLFLRFRFGRVRLYARGKLTEGYGFDAGGATQRNGPISQHCELFWNLTQYREFAAV
jgi:hypothetical protein